jgi:GABA permease
MTAPYVSAPNAMGIPAAAQIMNAVVLTAVLSALNSGSGAASHTNVGVSVPASAASPSTHQRSRELPLLRLVSPEAAV